MKSGPDSGLRICDAGPSLVHVMLDGAKRHNPLAGPVVDALCEFFAHAQAPVVVLGSTQPGTFCAGADVTIADDDRRVVSDRLYELYEHIRSSATIVIAAIDGPAIGGGAQLAIAADLRVAGPSAYFRFAGVGHGLVVGAWGLPELVGRGRAMDLCLTMRDVRADEALACGLIDRIDADPIAVASSLAAQIAAADRDAVVRAKRIIRDEGRSESALQVERKGNADAWDGSVAGLIGKRAR